MNKRKLALTVLKTVLVYVVYRSVKNLPPHVDIVDNSIEVKERFKIADDITKVHFDNISHITSHTKIWQYFLGRTDLYVSTTNSSEPELVIQNIDDDLHEEIVDYWHSREQNN